MEVGKCPFNDCNSQGHINGRSSCHFTIAACPNYYNTINSEWEDILSREEGLTSTIKVNFRPSELKVTEPSLNDITSPNSLYQFRRSQQCVVSDPEQEVLQHFETMHRLQEIQVVKESYPSIDSSHPDRISKIVFGVNEMNTWYQSDYPPSYHCFPKLFICEFCLRYFKYMVSYRRHMKNCTNFYPPGDEIYRYENNSFFEVDGELHKEYCHRLCLLAKLFLKQKTVSDLDRVVDFDFYILTENKTDGFHFIGYFSKLKDEKNSANLKNNKVENVILVYNLSCILVMPSYMRQGYSKLLIDFSYVLSSLNSLKASPERPLSDLGLLTYRAYWKNIILEYLSKYDKGRTDISIKEISDDTNLHAVDIITTLLSLDMIKSSSSDFFIVLRDEIMEKHKAKKSNSKKINKEYLDYNRVNVLDTK